MIPICVDLDGSLVRTDTLWESYLLLCKKNIFLAIYAIFKILSGKAAFKNYLAEHTELDVSVLPYNQDLLKWLRIKKQEGKRLILATASNQKIADRVAEHLEIFDEVIGSDVSNQMNAHNKGQLLIEKYGREKYDYVGNHRKDLPVWQAAKQAVVVDAKPAVLNKAKKEANVVKVFNSEKLTLKSFLKAIRVHQYVKNLLIFIPFLLAFQLYSAELFRQCIIGFFAFSFLASSVYVLNDLLDLRADRLHHSKKRRAFASGLIPIPLGLLLIVFFLALSVVFAIGLPIKFTIALIVYYLLTVSYSFYLKRKVLVDVCVLAGLYTIRIIAGMTLVNHGYSEWIIMFSMFLFLSLAFLKRYTELSTLLSCKRLYSTGRGYHVKSIDFVRSFGITSGYISALIITFYLNSNKALSTYTHPQFLWLISVVMLYWISRIWLLAGEGKVHDDPVVFAIKDKVSYLLMCCVAILIGLALWT